MHCYYLHRRSFGNESKMPAVLSNHSNCSKSVLIYLLTYFQVKFSSAVQFIANTSDLLIEMLPEMSLVYSFLFSFFHTLTFISNMPKWYTNNTRVRS